MAITLAYGKEDTSILVQKAIKVASKIKWLRNKFQSHSKQF
jgi:hypothetical protein